MRYVPALVAPLAAALLYMALAHRPALAAATTVGVTLSSGGVFLGGYDPAISPDGGYVSFSSRGAGYVQGTPAFAQIYLRNLSTGQVRLMSVSPAGLYGNEESFRSVVSRDGARVVFSSAANNLIPSDLNNRVDVFARGPGNTTFLISRSTSNLQGNFDSEAGDITPDGSYIVFFSGATGFAPPDQSYDDIYLRDSVNFTTTRVSPSLAGGEANGNSRHPVISDDARYVAFWSIATDLVQGLAVDTGGIYRRDRTAGVTELVSADSDGLPANADARDPSISADGRFVAFVSRATNLVAGDAEDNLECFVKDMQTGAVESVQRGNGGSPPDGEVQVARISGNGRYVAFISTSTNLLPGAVPAGQHAYVYDRETEQTVLASVEPDGGIPVNSYTSGVSISDDGQYVAFASNNPLLPEDVNGIGDVYVRGPLWGAPGAYTLADAAQALRIAGGLLAAGSTEMDRLNVTRDGASSDALDMLDAVRIARKTAALEPNP